MESNNAQEKPLIYRKRFSILAGLFSSLMLLNYHNLSTSVKYFLILIVCLIALKRLTCIKFSSSAGASEAVRWHIGEEQFNKNCSSYGKRITKNGNQVVVCCSSGSVYEGGFCRGKYNGSGVYRFTEKGQYEGDWIDGKYEGYGIESWTKGSQYKGQFWHGMRHGFGVYRFYSGNSYKGEWFRGQSHGRGVQTCSNGSCYVGEFKFGVKHGLGQYCFRNGDTYTGEYFSDKIHGFGVYKFANGHYYEGSWYEGRRQGLGMYKFRNGEEKSGEWDCGVLKNSCLPSDPSIQRVIQAARKAAENAFLPPQVEQINDAVAAASRAAVAARVAAIKAVQNQT